MRKLAVVMVLAVSAFVGGAAVENSMNHTQATCIVVDPNGAPAPTSCANPNGYQVANGH